MTIGIYALYWEEQDLIYIGQSRDVSVRTRRHLSDLYKKGHCNDKLQEAYNRFGKPEIFLLTECKEDDLESLEREYISEFDSVNNGLNKTHGSGSSSGTQHPSAKYSKYQILKVFSLLAKSHLSLDEIADRTKVHRSVVDNIRYGSGHFWLKSKWPTLWKNVSLRKVSTKSKSGEVTLISPEGVVYKNVQIAQFVKDNSHLFNAKNLRQVCNGFYKLTSKIRASYLGWSIENNLPRQQVDCESQGGENP